MTELDKKRKQVELLKCEAALAGMELTIFEREEDIKRIRDTMVIQQDHISKLKEELHG
jgi:hypothetical protein